MGMQRVLPGVRSLDETLKACPTCWMCRNMCPAGNETGREADTPRGFALVARAVLDGQMEADDNVLDILARCIDCRQCTNWCVSGYSPWSAVQAARRCLGSYAGHAEACDASLQAGPLADVVMLVPQSASAAAEAAFSLLRKIEPNAALLRGDSGYGAWVVGNEEVARANLARMVLALKQSGCHRVVTFSPTDSRFFADPPADFDASLGEGVELIDLVDHLHRHLRTSSKAPARSGVAFHDACSAPRGTGREDRARALLAAASGPLVELPWYGDRVQGCGQGGGLPRINPAMAGRLARARINEAKMTGAGVIVADAPECAVHLAAHADGTGMRVISLYEFLLEQDHER